MKSFKKTFWVSLCLALSGCGEKDPSFSLFSDSEIFYQTASVNNKLDILWVVDNSGSMANLQTNIANNFSAFIQDFASKSFDFQVAVTTTDAWRAPFLGNPSLAKFKDGANGDNSGVFVITPDTPDLINTFMTNITQGINGSGDERAFQSIKTALDSPLNAGFLREDGFLAVIIVSDEEDFSHDNSNAIGTYAPALHTVQSYVDYLDGLTNSTNTQRNYAVSSISIWDTPCLNANSPWGRIGNRYGELVDATEGEKGDVCSNDFAATLEDIQDRIAELSTQFYLSREPIVESIKVKVNDTNIPQDEENGWTYNSTAVSIVFHGTSIPSQGSQIKVDFDPATVLD
jgi:hypothetical protein